MISISGKQWEEKKVNRNLVEKLKQDHKFSEIVSKLIISRNFDNDEISSIENKPHLINIFKNNSYYIHTSNYETVGLPIYEALESGIKVIVPNEEYININNANIFKYLPRDIQSLMDACRKAINSSYIDEISVPIYYEDWNLI